MQRTGSGALHIIFDWRRRSEYKKSTLRQQSGYCPASFTSVRVNGRSGEAAPQRRTTTERQVWDEVVQNSDSWNRKETISCPERCRPLKLRTASPSRGAAGMSFRRGRASRELYIPSIGGPHQKSRGCILRLFRLRLHAVIKSFKNLVVGLPRMSPGMPTCSIRPIHSTA